MLVESYAAKSLKIPLSRDDRFNVFQVLARERKISQGILLGERSLFPTSSSDAFSNTLFKEASRRAKVSHILPWISTSAQALFYIFMSAAMLLAVPEFISVLLILVFNLTLPLAALAGFLAFCVPALIAHAFFVVLTLSAIKCFQRTENASLSPTLEPAQAPQLAIRL